MTYFQLSLALIGKSEFLGRSVKPLPQRLLLHEEEDIDEVLLAASTDDRAELHRCDVGQGGDRQAADHGSGLDQGVVVGEEADGYSFHHYAECAILVLKHGQIAVNGAQSPLEPPAVRRLDCIRLGEPVEVAGSSVSELECETGAAGSVLNTRRAAVAHHGRISANAATRPSSANSSASVPAGEADSLPWREADGSPVVGRKRRIAGYWS